MKKLNLIAAILCVVGIVIIGVAFALTKGDFKKFNSVAAQSYQKLTHECSSDISTIRINENSGAVEIKSGNVTRPVITYCETESRHYVISEEDGTLSIERDDDSFKFHFIDFNDYDIVLTVPSDYSGDIYSDTSSGSTSVSKVNCNVLDIKTFSGSIRILDTNASADMLFKASSGSIGLDNVSCDNLFVKNSSGSITFEDVSAVGNISAHGSSGSIKFDRLSAGGDIEFVNSSGSVKGTILGNESDYRITTSHSSGSCNLTDTTSGVKNLDVSTSSGSIKIYFERN